MGHCTEPCQRTTSISLVVAVDGWMDGGIAGLYGDVMMITMGMKLMNGGRGLLA